MEGFFGNKVEAEGNQFSIPIASCMDMNCPIAGRRSLRGHMKSMVTKAVRQEHQMKSREIEGDLLESQCQKKQTTLRWSMTRLKKKGEKNQRKAGEKVEFQPGTMNALGFNEDLGVMVDPKTINHSKKVIKKADSSIANMLDKSKKGGEHCPSSLIQ
ncbi:hypothetical protein QQ045_017184 [Rhodiola kirilowii]